MSGKIICNQCGHSVDNHGGIGCSVRSHGVNCGCQVPNHNIMSASDVIEDVKLIGGPKDGQVISVLNAPLALRLALFEDLPYLGMIDPTGLGVKIAEYTRGKVNELGQVVYVYKNTFTNSLNV